MYWKILKSEETNNVIKYDYAFESDILTGSFIIDKNNLSFNILRYADKSSNFDIGKLLAKLINFHKENKDWPQKQLFATG